MDSAILVQNIKLLCKAKGVPPTVACKEAGVGTSFITDINKGRTPSVAKVQMMATYLGCTVSDLLGESPLGQKEGPTPVSESEPLDSLEAQLMNLVRQLTPDSKKMLIAQLKVLLSAQEP